jgi:hypothetical protein
MTATVVGGVSTVTRPPRRPLLVQPAVEVVRRRHHPAMGGRPRLAKAHVVAVAALGAGAMTGGKGGSLVQEEELGVRAGAHDLPAAATELEATDDPPPYLREAHETAVLVVEDAAVAHEEAAAAGGHDVAEGGDAVLQGRPAIHR